MNDHIIAIIRTIVPVIAGGLVAELAHVGLEIDDAALVTALTSLAISIWYLTASWLERNLDPKFGILLGFPKPPAYETGARTDLSALPYTRRLQILDEVKRAKH